jgi:hypothetical protein
MLPDQSKMLSQTALIKQLQLRGETFQHSDIPITGSELLQLRRLFTELASHFLLIAINAASAATDSSPRYVAFPVTVTESVMSVLGRCDMQ